MSSVLKNPWVRFIGLLILLYLGFRVLNIIRGVLTPFALALVMAYIFDPVVDWMETKRLFRRPIRRSVAVGILVALFATVVGLFLFVVVPNAVLAAKEAIQDKEFEDVKGLLPETWRVGVEQWLASAPAERWLIVTRLAEDVFAKKETAGAVGDSIRAIAVSTFQAILWVFQFFLFFVVTIYLLIDIDHVRDKVAAALPQQHKSEIIRIARRLDQNVKAFFRGQVVVVMSLTLIFTIGLWIVGCPFWYIVGITGGLGAFVPYFWVAAGMVPAMILSFAHYGDLLHPLLAAGVFGFGTAMDNLVLTPYVLGRSVGMHPVIIILSILVFGTLFGFLGVIFAIPIAAVVKVLLQELFERYKRSRLYNGEPT